MPESFFSNLLAHPAIRGAPAVGLTTLPRLPRGRVGHASRLVPLADGRIHERQRTCPGEAVDAPPAIVQVEIVAGSSDSDNHSVGGSGPRQDPFMVRESRAIRSAPLIPVKPGILIPFYPGADSRPAPAYNNCLRTALRVEWFPSRRCCCPHGSHEGRWSRPRQS